NTFALSRIAAFVKGSRTPAARALRTCSGGRRPRSLRGGNRGPGSLGGAAMGIVVLPVVARCAVVVEFGPGEAGGDGDGGARRVTLRRRVCWNDGQERAPMRC